MAKFPPKNLKTQFLIPLLQKSWAPKFIAFYKFLATSKISEKSNV